jgi:hypothetical protein
LTWTRDAVAARIREARDTLRRVPAERVQGFLSNWPPCVQDVVEGLGAGDRVVRLSPASPRAIDRMHDVFGWFVHLKDRRQLTMALWLTAGIGMGPTRAGAVLGVHRDTARSRRNEALDIIVQALNASKARVA